jgi:transcriptional regulator with XRE-family HTH domain
MSQQKLAKLMNVSPQQISKIVKGHQNLTLETIVKLENALMIKLIKVQPNAEAIITNPVQLIPIPYFKEYISTEATYLDLNEQLFDIEKSKNATFRSNLIQKNEPNIYTVEDSSSFS